MKVIEINGSPRKQWNTATLVNKALEGAASVGGEVEMINLYMQTFIFTMNCPEEWLEKYNYPTILDSNREELDRVLGYAEKYFSCDTYQFADYSKIDMSLFDESEKRKHREKQFPIDEQKCFEMGVRLVDKVRQMIK